jgi:hypothetical protein
MNQMWMAKDVVGIKPEDRKNGKGQTWMTG